MADWKLPSWMEKYQRLITANIGPDPFKTWDPETLMNLDCGDDEDLMLTRLCMECKIAILEDLKAQGMLVHENMESYRCD